MPLSSTDAAGDSPSTSTSATTKLSTDANDGSPHHADATADTASVTATASVAATAVQSSTDATHGSPHHADADVASVTATASTVASASASASATTVRVRPNMAGVAPELVGGSQSQQPQQQMMTTDAAAAVREWIELTASQGKALLGSRQPCHRFHGQLGLSDYVLAADNDNEVVPPPPPLPAPGGQELSALVGVSFFEPIDVLCGAVHAYYRARKPGLECHTTDRDKLPRGIAMQQDTMLIFKPEPSALDEYPSCFRSMSKTKRGKVYVHGLHMTVYPTRRMTIETLERKIAQVRHAPCPLSAYASAAGSQGSCQGGSAREGGSGGDSAREGGSGGGGSREGGDGGCREGGSGREGWAGGVTQTRAPSCQYMRLACEALHAHWQRPDTPPNDSMMSYLLFHDIGARDSVIGSLLHDSWVSRLVYRALCSYDTEACAISNAGGVWTSMRQRLEDVLPACLHVHDPETESDDDASPLQQTMAIMAVGVTRLVIAHVCGLMLDDIPSLSSCAASYSPQHLPLPALRMYAARSVCVVLEVDADAPKPPDLKITVGGKLYTADSWYSVDGVLADSADLDEVMPERAAASKHVDAAACVVATPLFGDGQAKSAPIVVDIPEVDISTVFASLLTTTACSALVKRHRRRCLNKAVKADGERCWCHRDRERFPTMM